MDADRQIAREVTDAANAIVAAFGGHRTEDYFGSFSPDATFVFYNAPDRFDSLAQFRAEWDRSEREDGLRVLECVSSDQMVQTFGDFAVFSHTIRTRLRTNAGQEELTERETVVFAKQDDGRWLAVHEHLSPYA
ncbi:MAG TPA: nuclear transport factor 2 family protein [Thermoleophilia bacterium]|nr:nuclear transport factor 2 family protein [Thermoleophilia bacterium]